MKIQFPADNECFEGTAKEIVSAMRLSGFQQERSNGDYMRRYAGRMLALSGDTVLTGSESSFLRSLESAGEIVILKVDKPD